MLSDDLFPDEKIEPIADAMRILREAVAIHKPTKIFAGVSGGHDSITAAHLVRGNDMFAGFMNIDTTIGIPATQEYARDMARQWNAPFYRYRPPVSYEEIVMEHGFPGPGQHPTMYARLKERCIRQFRNEHREGKERIMLVTGVRKAESKRRMGTTEEHRREGTLIWCAPITNWTSDDKNAYIGANRIARNPIADKLCMSGECLCGAFARPEELAEIDSVCPPTAQRIRDLKMKVKAAGKWWKWGEAPPAPPDPRQGRMEFCHSCEARIDARKP